MSQTKVKSGLLNFPDQTDFVKLPSGTTAQRPSSPEKGYSRYNTTDNKLEYWNGTEWQQLPGLTPPIITSISYPGDDLAADPNGGQTITINGGDFKAGATVTVDGTTPSVITVVSATEITFTAPAKVAGDYGIVVTNVDGGNATAIDGMTYNGLPSWTTPAGNLGSFPAGSTIPTITLVATEPDSGVVSYSVTTGALPTGLTLTGADIDGTVPTPAGQTTYNFSVTASDDENQSTERAFNIVVYLQVTNTVDDHDPFGGNGLALYQLNGNANDVSGNYNGTATNVTYGTGIFGQAGVFNGSSSSFQAADGISSQGTDLTFSLWFKTTDNSATQMLVDFNYSAGSGIQIYNGNISGAGKLVFRVNTGGTTYFQIISASVISSNTWHNVVGTWQNQASGLAKLYLDGIEINTATSTQTGVLTLGSGNQHLGSRNTGVSTLNGSLDQVRIFNAALTPLEVESLYRERTVVCGGQADTLDILGDNSCIATYQLNGNANDLSGNYSGTPTNVSYGVGEFDLAGVFNGSSSYIDTSLILNPNAGSVSMWVKTTATVGTFFGVNSNGDGNRFYLGVRDSNFWIGAGDIQVYTVSAADLIDGDWHHVALTLDGSTAKYYLDGNSTPVATTSYSSIGLQDTNPIIGGIRTSGGIASGYYFNGSMDQVRIFNKALSSSEVTTLYNETACDALACSGTTNTLDILSDGSCIAAYPLDGSPADLSGNYNGVQTDVTYPVGKFDLAAAFNGSSSKIDLGNTAPFGESDVIKSISCWTKLATTSDRNYIYSVSGTADPINWFIIYYGGDTNNITVYRRSGSTSNTAFTSATITPDTNWHHVVVQLTATEVEVYLDGNKLTTTNSNTGTGTNTSWITYPAYSGTIKSFVSMSRQNTPKYTNGSNDQLRFFNKALNPTEVGILYNNETACN